MALVFENTKYKEPQIFYRDFENDVNTNRNIKNKNQVLRIALAALPFFGLYQPFFKPLAIGAGILRSVCFINDLTNSVKEQDYKKISYFTLQTTLAVASCAYSFFNQPVGMLIATGQDLFLNSNQLFKAFQRNDYNEILKVGMRTINNAIYLSVILTGSIEFVIISLAAQTILGLYESKEEFNKGNLIEAGSKFILSIIKATQLSSIIKSTNAISLNKISNIFRETFLLPSSVGKTFEEGSTLLYAYYPTAYTATALDGNHYGSQNIYNYNGQLIGQNKSYSLVMINGSLVMKHHYTDCDIYTDYSYQVVDNWM